MQVVHFTSEDVGSIDWELPKELAGAISFMPPEEQKLLIDDITRKVHGYVLLVVGTLELTKLNPVIAMLASDLLDERMASAGEELVALASRA